MVNHLKIEIKMADGIPAESFIDKNGNGVFDKKNLMYLGKLPGVEILERKTVYMDYVSKIDTLSMDSLYSASSNFKYSYNQRDLFHIEVDRYDEEMGKMDVGDSFLIKNERLSYIDSILLSDDSFNQNRFYFSIPFLADTIYYDLFYKEKEEKDFIVSSPVPKNENGNIGIK